MAKQVTVTKRDGRVTVDTDLNYLFSTMRNGTYHLIIKRASEARTIAQNDLMWMWMQCIEHETGTPKQDVYSYYCKKFLMKTIRIGERLEKVYDTTSKLNTKQMSDFMNKVQADAAGELGIQLPIPEDRYFEEFYQQYNV